jgi:Phycobilisome protein
MSDQLSETAKKLIAQARIVDFAAWSATHSAEAISHFQAADDAGRYLSDEDCQTITNLAPATVTLMPIAQQWRDQVVDIVDEARADVLTKFPGITEPGGGLYPAARADACWRDFWHFLRCITYGVAGQHTAYTSATGLHYMNLLYQELAVPLDAMVQGVEGLKTASLNRCEPDQKATLAPYFDHLITQLSQFTH